MALDEGVKPTESTESQILSMEHAAAVAIPDVEFTGLRGLLFKLALKNAILTLLTLGIYRFWAKTWVRRYFWHNIRVRGEALEYTGLPSELLIGFLIALAILAPIFMSYEGAYFFLSNISETTGIVLGSAYFLTLLIFFQFAFYRMWRYRLSRTTWRGIHFGLVGSAWKYMGVSFGWLVVTILTLGLAYPWYRVARWRFRTRNMRFGSSCFDFNGSANHLFKIWIIVFAVPLILLVSSIIFNIDIVNQLFQAANDQEYASARKHEIISMMEEAVYSLFVIPAVAVLMVPLLFVWYRVREMRYLIGTTNFLEASFQAPIKSPAIIFTVVLYLMPSIFLLGVILMASISAPHDTLLSTSGSAIGGAIFFLLLEPVLRLIILHFNFTKHVCSVLEIKNPEAFDQTVQSAKEHPEYGEGFADALDVGAI